MNVQMFIITPYSPEAIGYQYLSNKWEGPMSLFSLYTRLFLELNFCKPRSVFIVTVNSWFPCSSYPKKTEIHSRSSHHPFLTYSLPPSSQYSVSLNWQNKCLVEKVLPKLSPQLSFILSILFSHVSSLRFPLFTTRRDFTDCLRLISAFVYKEIFKRWTDAMSIHLTIIIDFPLGPKIRSVMAFVPSSQYQIGMDNISEGMP